MELNRNLALPGDLFHFRVIVRVILTEEIIEFMEDGEPMEPSQGYCQAFGVTGKSLADACKIIQQQFEDYHPVGGSADDPTGTLEMLEATIMDPSTVEIEGDEWRKRRGVHFTSGRVFFAGDESPPDNDITGVRAIHEYIYGIPDDEE